MSTNLLKESYAYVKEFYLDLTFKYINECYPEIYTEIFIKRDDLDAIQDKASDKYKRVLAEWLMLHHLAIDSLCLNNKKYFEAYFKNDAEYRKILLGITKKAIELYPRVIS